MKYISFTGISLEDIGLTRIIEAVQGNSNIKRLNVGILTNEGLMTVSRLLEGNLSLDELFMQETKDH